MPTVAAKLSFASKTKVEVVYGGNCVTSFHHLLTVTILNIQNSARTTALKTQSFAAEYAQYTTAYSANYPSLPVLFFCVNRIFKNYHFFFFAQSRFYLFYLSHQQKSIPKITRF